MQNPSRSLESVCCLQYSDFVNNVRQTFVYKDDFLRVNSQLWNFQPMDIFIFKVLGIYCHALSPKEFC